MKSVSDSRRRIIATPWPAASGAALLLAGAVACSGCGDTAGTQASAPASAAAQAAAPLPPPRQARYVRLTAVSEWRGGPFSAIAELNLLDATGAAVDRARWKVSADSADSNDPPANAIDGDPRTLWHSRWQGTPAPLPHTYTIDLGVALKLSGLRYLPRQDTTNNGSIAEYRIQFSDDGVDWGEPVAAGDFRKMGMAADEKLVEFAARSANRAPTLQTPAAQAVALGQRVSLALVASDADADPLTYSAEGLPVGLAVAPASGLITGTPVATGRGVAQLKVVDNKGAAASASFAWTVEPPALPAGTPAPVAGEVRFVKLEQLSEITGKPWASVAELNLLDAAGAVLPRTGWVASADSADASDQPQNAIDGNPASIWHSQWDGASPPPPHTLLIDLQRYARVGGFRLLPRQDKLSNGVIARWRFFTSVDGVAWSRPLAEGDFSTKGKPGSEQTVVLR